MGFGESIFNFGKKTSHIVNAPFQKPVFSLSSRVGIDKEDYQKANPYISGIAGFIGSLFGQPWVGPAVGGVLSTETDDSYTHAKQNTAYGAGGSFLGMMGSYGSGGDIGSFSGGGSSGGGSGSGLMPKYLNMGSNLSKMGVGGGVGRRLDVATDHRATAGGRSCKAITGNARRGYRPD